MGLQAACSPAPGSPGAALLLAPGAEGQAAEERASGRGLVLAGLAAPRPDSATSQGSAPEGLSLRASLPHPVPTSAFLGGHCGSVEGRNGHRGVQLPALPGARPGAGPVSHGGHILQKTEHG